MMLTAIRIVILCVAAVGFHFFSMTTSSGIIRFEFPFFIAVIYALRDHSPFPSAIVFLFPSLLFDALDNQFAGTLAHAVMFVVVRRIAMITPANSPSAVAVLAVIAAVIDRLVFGLAVGIQMGSGSAYLWSSLLDFSCLLAVLLLPFTYSRLRA